MKKCKKWPCPYHHGPCVGRGPGGRKLKNPSFSTRLNLVDPLIIILEKIIKDLSCVFSTQVH
jgi:hypothetical protein